MMCRGIRGATTVDRNTEEEIMAATKELLEKMIAANDINPDYVASALFTTSPDLNAAFPAAAARALGWNQVALMCGHEMNVPGSLPMCLRILIHYNTDKRPEDLRHIYIKGASNLRTFPEKGEGKQGDK
ncbi:MAG: chorismate mutase [Chloroflexi bacterium]|nr:chorismate mutase [Chloroflexota bacterium]